MRTSILLAAVLALALAGCSSSKPKPTGAGSTAVLRLMRDWRGVWSGHVKDSPMGAMGYTLYVEDSPEGITASSAPMREADLESLKHTWLLVHFDKGNPLITYTLTQRAKTQKGTVLYREDLSNEDDAVFCPEDGGCDKVRLTVTKVGEQALSFKSVVDEANHAQFDLTFSRREIPKDHGAEAPDKPGTGTTATPTKKNAPKVDEDGNAVDQDVVLKDHVDEDVGPGDKPQVAPKENKDAKDKKGKDKKKKKQQHDDE